MEYKSTVFFAILSLFLMGGFSFAIAEEIISVEFNPDPLIVAIDFLPGDEINGQIKVDNIGGQNTDIYMWTDSVSDSGYLGDVLTIKIVASQRVIYEGSLSKFFNDSPIFLSSLSPKTHLVYDVSLAFDKNAGNEYQNKGLIFDLYIGTSLGGNGGGGSSTRVIVGGGVILPTLRIFNLRSENIEGDKVTIEWQTNLPAATQVIYSNEKESHIFQLHNNPFYGYQHIFPDSEYSQKRLSHKVSLKNLSPCTIYFYRAISHNSSLAISEEKSFKTLCEREIIKKSSEERKIKQKKLYTHQKEETSSKTSNPTKNLEPTHSSSTSLDNLSVKISQGREKGIQPRFLPSLLANISRFINPKGLGCTPFWLIILLFIYSVFRSWQSILRAKKFQRENNLFLKKSFIKYGTAWIIWALLILLSLPFFIKNCVNWLLFIVFVLITFLIVLKSPIVSQETRETDRKQDLLPKVIHSFTNKESLTKKFS